MLPGRGRGFGRGGFGAGVAQGRGVGVPSLALVATIDLACALGLPVIEAERIPGLGDRLRTPIDLTRFHPPPYVE